MADMFTKMAKTTFLKTPLDIFNCACLNCPSVQAEVSVDQNGISLSLRFAQNIPSLTIRNAVDTQEFQVACRQIQEAISLKTIVFLNVDPKRFCLPALTLSDWQKFRRVMHEKANSCVDAIITYLRNPQNLDLLTYLGLAPNQVEDNGTENDLGYFRDVIMRCQNFIPQEKTTIVANFKARYPKTFKKLTAEIAQRELQQGKNDEAVLFQETLKALQNTVFGQPFATEKLTTTLISQKNRTDNLNFLFVGPTGVGKTELATAVGNRKNGRFIKFNMAEYSCEVDVTKFFGSPTGYVGSTDKPQFSKEVEKFNPVKNSSQSNSSIQVYDCNDLVILFDELEKAHSAVKQSLLSLLDKGSYKVGYTFQYENVIIVYNFHRSIFIGTSNLYQGQILQCFNQNLPEEQISKGFIQWNKELPIITSHTQMSFSPEFLGRCTIVPFGPIPKGECYQKLVRSMFVKFISGLPTELHCREFVLEDEQEFLKLVEKKYYGEGTNIRSLKNDFIEGVIRGGIYGNQSQWGNLQNKKLILFCHQDSLFLKAETYIDSLNCYVETPINPIKLL